MTKILHPNGEYTSYTGLPSLSDLMMACDNPKKRIRFVNGDPVIEDRPKRKSTRASKRKGHK
jgi:hypothetical protein